jgi:serine/threonine protein kinase
VKAVQEREMSGQLGQYRLLGVIGRGSMATVYHAAHPNDERPLALKTIRHDLLDASDHERLRARLRLEAEAGARLAHEGIVGVYEYGEQGAYCYIAMELVEGSSLQQRCEQQERFQIGVALDTTTQLLDALQHAHDRGIWHRDIKPANVLMTASGRIKLTDFGIARTVSSALPNVPDIMGTPGYVAPETYVSDHFDSRADVFAVGVLLYQLLTGLKPFAGRPDEIMFQVCSTTPAPPSVAGHSAALRHFDSLVLKALARNPEDRFASAAQLRAALVQAQRTH